MNNFPLWQYDEFSHLATDFHDPVQVEAYDANQNTRVEQEHNLVAQLGLTQAHTVLEYGSGTGAFATAAAEICEYVYAVDISKAMLDYAKSRAQKANLQNIEFHHAGFLTYTHANAPVDLVITKFAFHHLPDFWKCVALERIKHFLKPGGRFVLHDVIFSFDPSQAATEISHWIDEQTREGTGFSRADFEGHVRTEHSTFTWALESMFEQVGFHVDQRIIESPTYAWYFCTKNSS